jgi:putative spermidine/putrescine transport system ATP-binding protein
MTSSLPLAAKATRRGALRRNASPEPDIIRERSITQWARGRTIAVNIQAYATPVPAGLAHLERHLQLRHNRRCTDCDIQAHSLPRRMRRDRDDSLNANQPYLSIEALTVSYGATRVLDRVSLGVERGEMIALLGSSGCGKTTLLRAIAGFVRPESGTIRVGGKDITHLPPEARETAMMFQSYALWPHMNVADNIAYGLRMRRWTRTAIAARVTDMLKLLQLDGFGPRPVTQLSGGQRQRVALGRALAIDPHLLLLDEPMSNLDYKVRLELRHELRALQQRIGITAVYVTHDREEALTLSDRIAVIDGGRIVQVGAPEEIFHQPTSAFVAGFMGADNAIDVAQRDDGALSAAAEGGADRRVRAHFRSDSARLGTAGTASADGSLVLTGTIAQAVYVGQGYRYRVRTAGGDVWVHAPDRLTEGAAACVIVPREALLLFPPEQADKAAAGAMRPAA